MEKTRKWLQNNWIRYVIFLLSAVAGTTAFVVSILADGSSGGKKRYFLLWGGFAAFGVVLMAFLENRHSDSQKNRTQELAAQTINDQAQLYNVALVPLTDLLRDLCSTYKDYGPGPHLESLKKSILDGVLQAAVMLTAPPNPTPRARSTLWIIDNSSPNPKFKMEKAFPPNHRTPRPEIDGVGAAHMFNEILLPNLPFWLDGKHQTHSYLIPPPNGYEPVIAVPVRHGTEKIGILTVDSLKFGELEDRHVNLTAALANILAASMALR
ncbi:GAF domain-containing protein [Actinomadura luteofluorescens]|uniref:GAF domain-containing protein n=1 Tax=Actinomadura luteofluorescens TaxID=46163 RepID=UPI0030CB6D89